MTALQAVIYDVGYSRSSFNPCTRLPLGSSELAGERKGKWGLVVKLSQGGAEESVSVSMCVVGVGVSVSTCVGGERVSGSGCWHITKISLFCLSVRSLLGGWGAGLDWVGWEWDAAKSRGMRAGWTEVEAGWGRLWGLRGSEEMREGREKSRRTKKGRVRRGSLFSKGTILENWFACLV